MRGSYKWIHMINFSSVVRGGEVSQKSLLIATGNGAMDQTKKRQKTRSSIHSSTGGIFWLILLALKLQLGMPFTWLRADESVDQAMCLWQTHLQEDRLTDWLTMDGWYVCLCVKIEIVVFLTKLNKSIIRSQTEIVPIQSRLEHCASLAIIGYLEK